MLDKESLAILLYSKEYQEHFANFSYCQILSEAGYCETYGIEVKESESFSEAEVDIINRLSQDEDFSFSEEYNDLIEVNSIDYNQIDDGEAILNSIEAKVLKANHTYYTLNDDSNDYFESREEAESEARDRMFCSGALSFQPYLEFSEEGLRDLCQQFSISEDDFNGIVNKKKILAELKNQVPGYGEDEESIEERQKKIEKEKKAENIKAEKIRQKKIKKEQKEFKLKIEKFAQNIPEEELGLMYKAFLNKNYTDEVQTYKRLGVSPLEIYDGIIKGYLSCLEFYSKLYIEGNITLAEMLMLPKITIEKALNDFSNEFFEPNFSIEREKCVLIFGGTFKISLMLYGPIFNFFGYDNSIFDGYSTKDAVAEIIEEEFNGMIFILRDHRRNSSYCSIESILKVLYEVEMKNTIYICSDKPLSKDYREDNILGQYSTPYELAKFLYSRRLERLTYI